MLACRSVRPDCLHQVPRVLSRKARRRGVATYTIAAMASATESSRQFAGPGIPGSRPWALRRGLRREILAQLFQLQPIRTGQHRFHGDRLAFPLVICPTIVRPLTGDFFRDVFASPPNVSSWPTPAESISRERTFPRTSATGTSDRPLSTHRRRSNLSEADVQRSA